MSVVVFATIALISGAIAVLARRRALVSTAIGLVGLVAATVTAAAISDDAARIGGVVVQGSAFVRLFGLLGCVAGLLLTLVGLAAGWARRLPAATLLALGVLVPGLSVADPLVAVAALGVGGLAPLLVTGPSSPSATWPSIAAGALRAVVVSTVAASVAIAWVARPPGPGEVEPAEVGLAFLVVGLALAGRAGAIPFHGWAVRLPAALPDVGLPLALAWGPAALAVVALAWTGGSMTPGGGGQEAAVDGQTAGGVIATLALPAERAVIVAIGALTLALAAAAAVVHDDLERVLAYSILADVGILVLALAAPDAAAWEPVRRWLLGFVVTKSAFAGWVLAMRATFGTRRLRDLGGWVGRTPLLALALVAVAIATVGWPGMTAFEARAEVFRAATAGPFASALLVVALAPLAYFARLLAVGIGRRTPTVATGADPWPRRGAAAGRPRTISAVVRALVDAWRANGAPIAAALVLGLAGLAVVVAGGGLGVDAAGAAAPPGQDPGILTSGS